VRGWLLDSSPGDYRLGEVDLGPPGPGEVKVDLVASALNHMDLWLRQGLPKPGVLPMVPGCDGAGVVAQLGPEAARRWAVGDEVVINPSFGCGGCEQCLADRSVFCKRWGIMGERYWGSHAGSVIVPEANLVRRPAGRSWEECAAYGLCGLTAYRMLRRARLSVGETLLVVGAGGGVATALVNLGVRMGARVFATSRNAGKREQAVALGAVAAFPTGEAPVKADVVADSSGAATWSSSLSALARGGRLVTCGGTAGSRVELSLPKLFFGHYELIGSTMGTFKEFEELTALVAAGLPVVVDRTYSWEDYPSALARLEAAEQFGKVVLRHQGASSN
jgi:NADPH:quinone reductase-like Zn-dependent oxidoreductase